MRHLLLIAATTATLFAADESYNSSLRLTLTAMPDEGEIEATVTNTQTNNSTSFSDSGEWDDGSSRLSIAAFHNTGGPLAFNIGVGVAFTRFGTTDNGSETSLGEFGIIVEPGVSWNVSPSFSLELGVPLGVGSASYEEKDDTSTFEAEGGRYAEIGFVVRPVLKLNRFQAFLELGYITNSASFDQSPVDGAPNVEAEFDVTTSGSFVSLGVGIAF